MKNALDRRDFLKAGAAALTAATAPQAEATVTSFHRPDTLYHGDDWESLNPGYWQIKENALRRRIRNYGDRARRTGFPYHYETHGDRLGAYAMPVDYDPSLPPGFLWNRNWKLKGNYKLAIRGRIAALPHPPEEGDDASWKMYRPGYGFVGLAFGSSTLYESYGQAGGGGKAAWFAAWRDDGRFGIYEHGAQASIADKRAARPVGGREFTLTVSVSGDDPLLADLEARLEIAGSPGVYRVEQRSIERARPRRRVRGRRRPRASRL